MNSDKYAETLEHLYTSAPLFQQIGAGAYKEGLHTTHLLDEHFGHPHRRYATIHIAGTNGKGSCAHTLAAILQRCGLRVGLYTSPHLVDFRERIRVDGEMMPKQRVIDFVEQERAFYEPLHPSFFELTTALAFLYFAEQQVDVAVVEVGLGGRLDCTNIIRPLVSVVTNISLDHTQFLGSTPAQIAAEKAGIFKSGIPAIVGEATDETRPVFEKAAREAGTSVTFCEDHPQVTASRVNAEGLREYDTRDFGRITGALAGDCQVHNANTILAAVETLRRHCPILPPISDEHVREGFRDVCALTGLMGRWQVLRESAPRIVCDTGHNVGGWEYLSRQLARTAPDALHIVLGMVADKDVDHVLRLLPPGAHFYWTRASVKRSMDDAELARRAAALGLHGPHFPSVRAAYEAALEAARTTPDATLFVGGSNFVVADLLAFV